MDKHDTLLIASGSASNREHLRGVLGEGFHLLEAVNSQQTILLLSQNISCIAAILMDITEMDSVDETLLHREESVSMLAQVPVIIISKDDDPFVLSQAFGFGASDVIPIGYDPYAMLHRIENIVQLHLHKQYLETMVEEQANALRHTNDSMVDVLSSIIEYRSVESGQHILRIRHFTKILLEEVVRCCPEYNLTDHTISIICSASALHDIGKIAIPDSILMKPGKLTEEEMDLMKTHSVTGCHILDTLTNVADREYLRYAHNICHYHHERWDGRGYPEGISGDEIPICAQVVGLADVYDALTTKRVYKDAVSFAQAVNMILKGECGAFSPKLLECFKHVTHLYEELARDYADGMSPKAESFDTTLPMPMEQKELDSMERTRGKYFALVHYINGFLLELDMDLELFHLVYNPYPELAQFQGITTLDELKQMILEKLVHPKDAQRMRRLIHEGIGNFLDEGLRRQSDHFRFRSRYAPEGEMVEITFLRINPLNTERRTLAVLARKTGNGKLRIPDHSGYALADGGYFCHNDRGFTLLKFASEFREIAGYTAYEIETEFGGQLLALVHPEDRRQVSVRIREQLKRSTEAKLEYRIVRKDGSVRWVLNKSRMYIGLDGQEYLHSLITDITGTKQANEELIKKLNRYEIILAQTENVLFEWDVRTDTITFSDTWEKIFGFSPIGQDLSTYLSKASHFHPDDLPLLFDSIGNIENGSDYEMVEARIATDRGRYLWCRIRATAIRDSGGDLLKISGIIINVDTEKQTERALQDRAERDSLTKLLNKDAGRRQTEEYLSRFPDGVHSAMFIIDLDDFKQVNDRYGHLFGDSVLTQAAREIKRLFRNQDIVSRIGGDEFMVLMRGVSDRKLVENRSQRLISIFRSIFRNQSSEIALSCSIGIAFSPEHGMRYVDLFSRADQALYRAKANGKNNYVIFDGTDDRIPYQGMGSAVNNRIDSDEEPGLAEDNIVRYSFQRLYTSTDVEKSVNDILEMIGRKMNVSRVYIFENSDDNRFCSNTFEWCNEGIEPQIRFLQNISYEADLPNYEENFNEQGIFYCPDIQDLPQQTYDIVAPQGIKSMLHCAIREGGVFRGYIGFDECVQHRFWTKDQIQTLTYFSEMLSVFLLKQRKQEKSMRYAQEMQSLLDNRKAWIYIIEPDSFRLKYINRRTAELSPDIKLGMPCYKALMGRTERCAGCPGNGIREEKIRSALIQNDRFGLKTLAEATLIQWEGEEACLITCREIPEET